MWLTKDGIPVIFHGGDEGEMEEYNEPDTYIYEYTLDEINRFDIGDG